MCHPVALAFLGAASAGAQFYGAQKQAEATNEAAEDAARFSQAQNQRRAMEEGQQISAKAFERTRQANRERAKIRAAAANQGLTGVGVSRQLAISDVNTAIDLGRIQQNLDNSQAAFMANEYSIRQKFKSRVVDGPNPFMGLLSVAMGAVSGASLGVQLGGSLPTLGSLSSQAGAKAAGAVVNPFAKGVISDAPASIVGSIA